MNKKISFINHYIDPHSTLGQKHCTSFWTQIPDQQRLEEVFCECTYFVPTNTHYFGTTQQLGAKYYLTKLQKRINLDIKSCTALQMARLQRQQKYNHSETSYLKARYVNPARFINFWDDVVLLNALIDRNTDMHYDNELTAQGGAAGGYNGVLHSAILAEMYNRYSKLKFWTTLGGKWTKK